jgi:hypothetical protein
VFERLGQLLGGFLSVIQSNFRSTQSEKKPASLFIGLSSRLRCKRASEGVLGVFKGMLRYRPFTG